MNTPTTAYRERWLKLRALRERTGGAPLSACDEALKACGGDVDAAAEHPAVWRKNLRDGDPVHRCTDDCPPWPFRWGGPRGSDGHACSTHCRRHPDPRTGAPAWVAERIIASPAAIEGALSICDWHPTRTVEFLCAAGAPHPGRT